MNSNDTYGQPVAAGGQAVAYTGTAGTSSTIAVPTSAVRLVSTTDCFIEISVLGTAAAANTGTYLPAFQPEYFYIPPNAKVSAIQVSAGGTLYISPFIS